MVWDSAADGDGTPPLAPHSPHVPKKTAFSVFVEGRFRYTRNIRAISGYPFR